MHVRSLYDADAVLRRAADVLRTLSVSDSAAVPPLGNGHSPTPPLLDASVHRREPMRTRRVALVAALRRSREVLDALQRSLAMRTGLPKARSTL